MNLEIICDPSCFNQLESSFDNYSRIIRPGTENFLRAVKIYLRKNKDERNNIFKGTLLWVQIV